MYIQKNIESDIFKISKNEIFDFAKNYDPMFFHMDESKAEDSIFNELVSSGLHTICIMLQKMNEFSDWKIATGLEHTVKYLKPVKPDVNYQVTGKVNYEELWKNPKYTHLKMENVLKENGKDQNLVILDTSFLIYS
tara:strand:+ start:444 stop:851 length:408 start_codon:yes stop_codon:yes gene_type:complete